MKFDLLKSHQKMKPAFSRVNWLYGAAYFILAAAFILSKCLFQLPMKAENLAHMEVVRVAPPLA